MRKSLAALALVVAVTAQAGMAAEAGLTDLKGRWVGMSESIVTGRPLHHGVGSKDKPLLSNVAFTLTIKGQDGRRFWGTVSSPRDTERVTGVIGFDGKTIVAQDLDGLLQGTLVDPDTIDLIYSHTGRSTVVTAIQFRRAK